MKMDFVSIGEILIDMFPAEVGRTLGEVTAFYPKPGGACANAAVAVAKLGKKSAFIGKVGDEAFGQVLIQTLVQNGVETRGMRVDAWEHTTLAFIAMPDENSAEFIFYRNPGADLSLREDELERDLLTNTKVLHCGSLLLVDDPARLAQYAAVEVARENGALISFDVNYRPALWQQSSQALEQIWKMVSNADLLKVNEVELELLTGMSDPAEGSRVLIQKGAKLVAVTLGTKGSYYCTSKHQGHIPPFWVKTVDAIGCGDAFIAGLLCQLVEISDSQLDLSEADLVNCFTFANAVGAVTALSRGVIPALPTATQVNDFITKFHE